MSLLGNINLGYDFLQEQLKAAEDAGYDISGYDDQVAKDYLGLSAYDTNLANLQQATSNVQDVNQLVDIGKTLDYQTSPGMFDIAPRDIIANQAIDYNINQGVNLTTPVGEHGDKFVLNDIPDNVNRQAYISGLQDQGYLPDTNYEWNTNVRDDGTVVAEIDYPGDSLFETLFKGVVTTGLTAPLMAAAPGALGGGMLPNLGTAFATEGIRSATTGGDFDLAGAGVTGLTGGLFSGTEMGTIPSANIGYDLAQNTREQVENPEELERPVIGNTPVANRPGWKWVRDSESVSGWKVVPVEGEPGGGGTDPGGAGGGGSTSSGQSAPNVPQGTQIDPNHAPRDDEVWRHQNPDGSVVAGNETGEVWEVEPAGTGGEGELTLGGFIWPDLFEDTTDSDTTREPTGGSGGGSGGGQGGGTGSGDDGTGGDTGGSGGGGGLVVGGGPGVPGDPGQPGPGPEGPGDDDGGGGGGGAAITGGMLSLGMLGNEWEDFQAGIHVNFEMLEKLGVTPTQYLDMMIEDLKEI